MKTASVLDFQSPSILITVHIAREQHPQTFSDAIAHLDQAGKYLAQLADSVSNLSKWISSMKAVFLAFQAETAPDENALANTDNPSAIQNKLTLDQNPGSNSNSAAARNEWISIRTEFIECKSSVRVFTTSIHLHL